jgi:DNA polymerase-3 subunit epsilon
MLWQWVKEYDIHPALFFLDKKNTSNLPDVEPHNLSVNKIVSVLKEEQKSYLIKEATNYILVDDGKFYGMGTLENETIITNKALLKQQLTPYPENEVLKGMLRQFVTKYPERIVML